MSGVTNPSNRRRRRRDVGHKPNHERWMISYADLLTLMLAVFIVLYATKAQNTSKMKALAASMMEAFSGTPPAIVSRPSSPQGPMNNLPKSVTLPVQAPPSPKTPMVPHNVRHLDNAQQRNIQRLSAREQRDLQPSILAIRRLRQKLEKLLQPEITKKNITINARPLEIKIRLNAKILFGNGKANLTAGAVRILAPVATTLSAIPPGYQISIDGYTDNQPIHTRRFPSNWQLSTARALSVLELFRANKVPGKALSAEGFSKYHPIASNGTAAGREKNRRVSIVITAPSGRADQPAKAGGDKGDVEETGKIRPPQNAKTIKAKPVGTSGNAGHPSSSTPPTISPSRTRHGIE